MNWLTWDASASRSRMLQSGGNGGANFKWNGGQSELRRTTRPRTTNPNVPMFSASCFAAGPTNTEDIANYKLSKWTPASVGESAQLNLQGSAAYGRIVSRRGTVRHDRVRRQDPERAQVQRLVHDHLHGQEGRDDSRCVSLPGASPIRTTTTRAIRGRRGTSTTSRCRTTSSRIPSSSRSAADPDRTPRSSI